MYNVTLVDDRRAFSLGEPLCELYSRAAAACRWAAGAPIGLFAWHALVDAIGGPIGAAPPAGGRTQSVVRLPGSADQ